MVCHYWSDNGHLDYVVIWIPGYLDVLLREPDRVGVRRAAVLHLLLSLNLSVLLRFDSLRLRRGV